MTKVHPQKNNFSRPAAFLCFFSGQKATNRHWVTTTNQDLNGNHGDESKNKDNL
jgi:hypothetical protein